MGLLQIKIFRSTIRCNFWTIKSWQIFQNCAAKNIKIKIQLKVSSNSKKASLFANRTGVDGRSSLANEQKNKM
jgi:hypothetical protein